MTTGVGPHPSDDEFDPQVDLGAEATLRGGLSGIFRVVYKLEHEIL